MQGLQYFQVARCVAESVAARIDRDVQGVTAPFSNQLRHYGY